MATNVDGLVNDPLHLANSDHPGMVLTNTPFNGTNFLGWSRTVKMALGAKLKIGFIDGTLTKPVATHADYGRWTRCDYMVTCWLLNSMTAELSEAFLYAQSAKELWAEIEERYGQSNGPLIFHTERELSRVTQGNMSIVAYYNKMKKFWDELHSLNGIPVCTCGKMGECTCKIMVKYAEIESRSRLMQFLMKLNDDYESVRNQILSMDPLPTINKAYYIVQQVEKQKQVTHHTPDHTAFFANNANKGNQNFKKFVSSDNKGEKPFCTHCKQTGHLYEQCFERLGYPDWYKGNKVKKGGRMAAQISTNFGDISQRDSPFDMEYENEIHCDQKSAIDRKLVATVCTEMMKMLKGNQVIEGHNTDCGKIGQPHAGMSFHARLQALVSIVDIEFKKDWVNDTGATDHMSPHLELFHDIIDLKYPIKVKLPDGSHKLVTKIGKDLTTNKVVAVGKGTKNLYVCKGQSSSALASFSVVVASFVNKVLNNTCKQIDASLFHHRLGHTSVSKLIHIDEYKNVNISNLICETCVLSKQHKLPFPVSHSRTNNPFELIHVDLWGPYKVSALNGAY
uniref:uncharacterized protein LOC122610813 n=1 Tax=Erigeron canadensis TaxID=72917 RepID=UPI001CB9B7C7|nr:uncharacterized protein LOC122610813 [Erigeron canadensis]